MKLVYVVQLFVMCVLVSILINKTYDLIDDYSSIKDKKGNPQVSREKRKLGLFLNGVLLVGFIKHEMNTYPSLHDLSLLVLICIANQRFIFKYVEPYLVFVLTFGLFYSICGMACLWVTWLQRFSGNANFFYFQSIAYNAFIVLIFI